MAKEEINYRRLSRIVWISLSCLIHSTIAYAPENCCLTRGDVDLRVPPLLKYNGTVLKKTSRQCHVAENCSDINLLKDVFNYSRVSNDTPYISLDGLLICQDQTTSLNFSSTSLCKHCLTSIHVENCSVTWQSINELGLKVSLTSVNIVANQSIWNFTDGTASDFAGLSNLTHVDISFTNNRYATNSIDLSQFLPNVSSLKSVRELDVRCSNTSLSPPVCRPGWLKANMTSVQRLFPKLQTLVLFNLHMIIEQPSLRFPRHDRKIELPENFALSEYECGKYYLRNNTKRYPQVLHLRGVEIDENVFDVLKLGELDYLALFNISSGNRKDTLYDLSDEFLKYSRPKFIEMTSMNIKSISSDTFGGQKHLRALYLFGNHLLTLPTGAFKDLKSLEIIDLSQNQLTSLKKGTFKHLNQLVNIVLFENNIRIVESDTFPRYPPRLNYIDISYNLLEKIPFDFLHMMNIQQVNMNKNTHLSIENLKESAFHFDPVKFYLLDAWQYNMNELSALRPTAAHLTVRSIFSLQDCSITKLPDISSWTWSDMKRVTAMLCAFNFDIIEGDNSQRIDCDCRAYYFKNFIQRIRGLLDLRLHILNRLKRNLQVWTCKPNPLLSSPLIQVNLYNSNDDSLFICRDSNTTWCLANCTCYTSPNKSNMSAVYIDCQNKSFSYFPEITTLPNHYNKIMVKLAHNNIRDLPDCTKDGYRWLTRVTRLDMSYNIGVSTVAYIWDKFVGCIENVSHLNMDGMKMEYLPEAIRRLNLTSLTLDGNSFKCDCHNRWMKDWLQHNDDVVKSRGVTCTGRDRPIVELDVGTDFRCDLQGVEAVGGFFIAISTLCTIAILVVFYIQYNEEIKLIVFDRLLVHPFDQQQEISDALYDVYLIYSDNDYSWTQSTLWTGLEHRGYKVYDKYKDSPIGDVSNIAAEEAMSRSHRAIAVLSKSFYNDSETLSVFNRADHYQTDRGGKKYMIVVKVDDIQDYDQIREDSRQSHILVERYLKTRCYIDVNSRWFWTRLFYCLPSLYLKELPDVRVNQAGCTS